MLDTLKRLFSPIQMRLLARGSCVACLMPLAKATREEKEAGNEKVVCKCGRIYIYTKDKKSYRRANFDEV